MEFLYALVFVGLVIALCQDLKRQEVDDWLNLFLIISTFAFLIFNSILNWDSYFIFIGIVVFLIMFFIETLFYYSRIFGGGDAKLLLAIFGIFIGFSFSASLMNIGFFVLAFLFAGSLYGLIYEGYLIFSRFDKIKKYAKKNNFSKKFFYVFVFSALFSLLGFFNWAFFYFAGFLLFIYVVSFFARAIESELMVRNVFTKNLVEGDLLVEDVKVNGKVIKKDWEGLTDKDIKLLRKKKKVWVKYGIPYVPAFVIAFIVYYFRDFILNFIF